MRGLRSAVIVVLSLGLLLCGGEAAIADTTTEFDLQGFTSTVVDTTNSHVIVSGSSPNSSVAVFGYTGALVKRLTGETDAGGMVIVGST
ncbi:MAG: hypothetical protein QOJ31_1497, partial [Gaiellales bacterium]|nr:hypothetical protein [Gaiellales bacterium]